MNTLNVLFLGDVVGKAGRRALRERLSEIKEKLGVDLTIANAENAAEAFGLAPAHVEELCASGVDQLTSGDHVWDRREILPVIDIESRLLRPANYPEGVPGRGSAVVKCRDGLEAAVLNLQGRVFMFKQYLDDPFRRAGEEIARLKRRTPVVIVDFHAEATSEKAAMGWHLDGMASAVIGTHTHVQTADERILPKGTAFISDVGMVGPRDSVIGLRSDRVLERFMKQMAPQWKVAEGAVCINGALVEVDEKTGTALSISRVAEIYEQS